MTEPNPDAQGLPLPGEATDAELPEQVKARLDALGGEWPDPVKATAPVAEPAHDDQHLDDEHDESADEAREPVVFPIAGPMTGAVVPPGIVNPQ